MVDNRTRMNGVAHDDGGRICLVAADEDGVSFRSTLTRASDSDTPVSTIMYTPTVKDELRHPMRSPCNLDGIL